MTDPLSNRQRRILADLARLISERAAAEPEIESGFRARMALTEQQFQEVRQKVVSRQAADKEASETEFAESRRRITEEFDRDHNATQQEISATRKRIKDEFAANREKNKAAFQEARWTLNAFCEASKNRAEEDWRAAQELVVDQKRKMQTIQLEADKLVLEWRKDEEPIEGVVPESLAIPSAKKLRTVPACITAANDYLQEVTQEILPGYLKRRFMLAALVFVWLVAVSGLALVPDWVEYWYYGPAAAVLGAIILFFGGKTWLVSTTRAEIFETYQPLCQTIVQANALCTRYLLHYKKVYMRKLAKANKKHNRRLRRTHKKYLLARQRNRKRRDSEWRQAEEDLRQRWARIKERRDSEWHQAEEKYRRLQAECQQRYDHDWQQAHDTYFRKLEENKNRHESEWQDLGQRWQNGMDRLASAVKEINQENSRLFPPWSDPSWTAWVPPTTLPPGIRFGEYHVNLADLPDGISQSEHLRSAGLLGFALPAGLAFPNHCSMLFKASDEGRMQAVEAIQAVMLRFLTTIPPGKVRFTIIDPVGLGQNFSAFMHLADYDEQLVASRIWTELAHIEQRLADLTGHMENVIQKYLRNQFETIEEYNVHAGEVAEPFRVLVVANFPANFSVEATRRLISIVSSGARCGVYTLISVDTKQHFPQGFNLADLERPCLNLVWQVQNGDRTPKIQESCPRFGGRFVWKNSDFERFPLSLDGPPSAEFCTQLINRVGEQAKDANRVEVPFEFIAPAPDRWWKASSTLGINVPLGRVGATKRQHLHLGVGTAHHVLIAGKTGSGKSTLLHALITNLALYYSPDEVELYLIDFKKGVEFKTYATHELPHARVVAVESEREFGLSVLQRLDAELKQRGDRFRDAGAQNLAAYREVNGQPPTPRILLIVDEFQEFFIEDDKIAQESAQLLDRLVRQGRAFGLHVMLGSQTLGGAYSLARSTIDQMAVRIALQCSEADGHIILSDDNSAARLLSRPGEAIYNDANGLVEGNNPFQVVWLSDEDREVYLENIHALDQHPERRLQIVFEGNAPADVGKNHLLNELLHASVWPAGRRPRYAWLGEAMAIKDPTAATFRPQSGSNLLMVGQHDESALGILATALVSLAAQHALGETEHRAASSRFYVLDGSPEDSPHAGLLGRLAEVLPHPLRTAGWRDLAGAIAELADEVERRQKVHETDAPAQYLLVYGLQRFRDLRRQDDDFSSFSRRGEEKPSPAKQFGTILREGPGLGIHSLIWCDSLTNAMRCFDRQGMREFEMRVLFQMSGTDSSVLIDTPLAGKLGLHRALFHSEDQGKLEKFRPYGLPAETWLAEVGRLLRTERAAESALVP